MKKLLLVASVLLATSAFAEKIGVVDTQKVVSQFSETKKAQQSLESEAKRTENEAKQREVALQKEQVALQSKGDKLTDAEKKAFEKKVQDYENFINSSQEKLNKAQFAKLQQIETVYNAAVKKVVAAGKYDFVFEADAVKFGGEDITAQVLKEMEASKK
ncbi:OmpH family outer membrane protein [Fusobacterium massiliense]|uniref:OmpH family outer membrane protein n=1 Tax=Fusobacterium massiliense TaxID=1852365 RepID=UPI0028EE9291|nr:OmpH family outer membrane protein [Fusobacterium massiliense]